VLVLVVRFSRDTLKPPIISVLHPSNPLDPQPSTKDDDEEEYEEEDDDDDEHETQTYTLPIGAKALPFFYPARLGQRTRAVPWYIQ
jgi:hypothetical protein